MAIDLTTTNLLLGILAAVSVLEALGLIGLFVGALLLARRLRKALEDIEARQIAPAAARVNAILDDVQGVTTTVRCRVEGVNESVGRVIRLVRRVARV